MKKRDPIAEYCQDWVRWTRTRKFYIQPAAGSLLGRLQPSKTGVAPNARNCPDMPYFNMAIHTLADMPKWRHAWLAFNAHYLGPNQVAKITIADLGMAARTYYDYIKRFSAAAYSMAASIKRVQQGMDLAPNAAGARVDHQHD